MAAPSALPEVQRQGSDLVAAGERFRAWGFNYGIGDRYPILSYFDRPTERRLQRVVADMREARLLGANTLRVYLEIEAFMNGPISPGGVRSLRSRPCSTRRSGSTSTSTSPATSCGERRPPGTTRYPNRLDGRSRRNSGGRSHERHKDSPAVLVYELTSEPVIDDAEVWYCGEMGGYTFVQRIVREIDGRDPSELARRWVRLLTASIRVHDRRHLIGLGMLPLGGPFGAANVADLVDVLLLHEYPEDGRASEAISLVREFAAHGKPVILGETAPLFAGADTGGRS